MGEEQLLDPVVNVLLERIYMEGVHLPGRELAFDSLLSWAEHSPEMTLTKEQVRQVYEAVKRVQHETEEAIYMTPRPFPAPVPAPEPVRLLIRGTKSQFKRIRVKA